MEMHVSFAPNQHVFQVDMPHHAHELSIQSAQHAPISQSTVPSRMSATAISHAMPTPTSTQPTTPVPSAPRTPIAQPPQHAAGAPWTNVFLDSTGQDVQLDP